MYGKKRSPYAKVNQSPLGSPSAAETHVSIKIGPVAGAAFGVVSKRAQKETMRTLASLIGRKNQWSGMSAPVRRMEAARSSVRLRQLGVPSNLLIGRLRVPHEMAGRV